MNRLSFSLARRASFSWRAMVHLRLGVICVVVLVGTSTLAGAASSASAAKFSARLTKSSFTSAQASSVKLVCTFPKKSGSFSYLLTFKKGKKWQTVKAVKKVSYRKGSHTMTVKKVFAGKAVRLGSYRLKVSAGSASKLLRFTVVKAKPVPPPPTGSAPANTSLPTISGTAKQGQTLTASNGAWTGSPTSYAYRWDRCVASGAICADIGGATSSTYVLALGDVGSTMRVIVTATNAHGSASATSSQTATVTGVAPVNSALPTISGTAKQGQTLTASNGSWSNSPTGYAFQWRRCDGAGANCSDIGGATSSTYALVVADADSTVRVVATASNSYGSASATSSQTSAVSPIVVDVSASYDHSCAVLSNGKVECWGANDQGQLGNGTQTNSPAPVQVSGITTAVQVSAGWSHTCAVLADHTVRCWGNASEGQLGNGDSVTDSTTPVQVEGTGGSGFLSGVTQVSAGNEHTCAVLSDHTVRCWGSDYDGELGDGNFGSTSSTPVAVLNTGGAPGSSLANVAQVSAGSYFTCAVLSTSGWIYCWGDDESGQLGDNSTGDSHNNRVSPVRTGSITGAGGVSAGSSHACAVTGGAVWCWGYNGNDQLGNNDPAHTDSSIPVRVVGAGGIGFLGGATSVGVTIDSSCALLSDNSIDCWGNNYHGQLGDNSPDDTATPVRVSGISTATELSAGSTHVCALLSDHSVNCWGSNFDSQLGIGKIGHSTVPISVSGITDASGLSSGSEHACAIRSGGAVWCWGHNEYGQLGNGSTTDSSTPVQVKGAGGAGFLTGVTQVSAGAQHTCALVSSGAVSVWCWGDDSYGQLGDGTIGDADNVRLTPVQVEGVGGSSFLTGVTKVSSGGYHTCALTPAGSVRCWGNDYEGELGNNVTLPGTNSLFPVLTVIANATDISAGNYHTCAVLSTGGGTVWCWGWNYYGQLGNGATLYLSTTNSSTPVQVKNLSGLGTLSGASTVSAGWFHTCAVITGGAVDCWGRGASYALGDGNDSTDYSYPVQVYATGTTPQTGVAAASAGSYDSCALIGSGVKCWGDNEYGQLGNGTTDESYYPTPVSSLANVAAMSVGGDNSDAGEYACALITGGAVKCWGTDYYGELGDGGVGLSVIPLAVVGLP